MPFKKIMYLKYGGLVCLSSGGSNGSTKFTVTNSAGAKGETTEVSVRFTAEEMSYLADEARATSGMWG